MKYLHVLFLIVFLLIGYQIGKTTQLNSLYEERKGRNIADMKLMRLQLKNIQKELAQTTKDKDKILAFMTGAIPDLRDE
jgi:hypothetical protein